MRLAEEDLRLRGPGDLFGSRQHGIPGLKAADLGIDAALLDEARRAAVDLLGADPDLSAHPVTAARADALLSRRGGSAAPRSDPTRPGPVRRDPPDPTRSARSDAIRPDPTRSARSGPARSGPGRDERSQNGRNLTRSPENRD